MALLLTLLLTLAMLLFSISQGIFVGFPLLISTLLFLLIAHRRGFSAKVLWQLSAAGGKKAFIVLRIFVLIGAITGIWMASGTVPSIVYYGILYMDPNLFILYAFLITSMVSFLLGTSFGTIGTVGVALILMAKSGEVNLNLSAGAIMAGAYFGDRCSPMSSSANLVAHLTGTDLYANIKAMFKTAALPLVIAIIGYGLLSFNEPLGASTKQMSTQIQAVFNTHWIALLPAMSILVLALFKVNVKRSMGISIGIAALLAFFVQGVSPLNILRFTLLGFELDSANPLHDILIGGGVISMWKAIFIVFLSSVLANIFDGTQMLSGLETFLMKANTRLAVFINTILVGIMSSAIGCNQAIAVFLTEQLMRKTYQKNKIPASQLALDIENTGIVIAALIPWNIAAFVPTSTLGVSPAGYIPYAFYLYLIPIFQVIYLALTAKKTSS